MLLPTAGFQLQIRSAPPESHRQVRLALSSRPLVLSSSRPLVLSCCPPPPAFKRSLAEVTHPNFWNDPTKRLGGILSDQTWQVTDDAGSLHLLTHTGDKYNVTIREI